VPVRRNRKCYVRSNGSSLMQNAGLTSVQRKRPEIALSLAAISASLESPPPRYDLRAEEIAAGKDNAQFVGHWVPPFSNHVSLF
jgi:hypothetical protein